MIDEAMLRAQREAQGVSCDLIDAEIAARRPRRFRLGDRVRKLRGSSWQGRVVGFYSTRLTPVGYCVESEREPGSVQIYPEAAPLTIRGVSYRLVRPLNSRDPWPLYAEEVGNPDAEPVEVFDKQGNLSEAFQQILPAVPFPTETDHETA